MTDKTAIFTARVPNDVMEMFEGIDKRKALETLTKWLIEGDVEKKDGQLAINRSVYTKEESVYTEGKSVYTENSCDGCPYIENALDMSKFDEVCEYKGYERQKALDKCVQMLWR